MDVAVVRLARGVARVATDECRGCLEKDLVDARALAKIDAALAGVRDLNSAKDALLEIRFLLPSRSPT